MISSVVNHGSSRTIFQAKPLYIVEVVYQTQGNEQSAYRCENATNENDDGSLRRRIDEIRWVAIRVWDQRDIGQVHVGRYTSHSRLLDEASHLSYKIDIFLMYELLYRTHEEITREWDFPGTCTQEDLARSLSTRA